MNFKPSAVMLYAMLSGASVSAGVTWGPVYSFAGFVALAVLVLIAG
jgi:hypothetical protein